MFAKYIQINYGTATPKLLTFLCVTHNFSWLLTENVATCNAQGCSRSGFFHTHRDSNRVASSPTTSGTSYDTFKHLRVCTSRLGTRRFHAAPKLHALLSC